jgi:hypothetical protein
MNFFFFLASIAFGLLLIMKPAKAIELQRRAHVKFNWRLEPVNMTTEIRNTQMLGFMIMGALLTFIVYTVILTGGKFKI